MAAIDSLSSCGPQAPRQPMPPMAHAPKPTGVIEMSESPSFFVFTLCILTWPNSVGVNFSSIQGRDVHPRFCGFGELDGFMLHGRLHVSFQCQTKNVWLYGR